MEIDEQNSTPVNTVYKEIRLKISGSHNIAEERTLKLIQELLEKAVTIEKIQVEHTKPGYRFVPKDEELILDYLKKKIMNEPLMNDEIQEVNLYQHDPQYFSERYDSFEGEWYFFTPRDRKYLRGSRPNRAAGTGYWKATGADKKINYNGETVGFRKVLVFYEGKPPKGDKTCWIMHEYRVNQPARVRRSSNDMRLDDYVLCRIYKKANKTSKDEQPEFEESVAQPVLEFPEPSPEIEFSQEINILLGNNTMDCVDIMNHGGGLMFDIGVEYPNELSNIVADHVMTPLPNVLPQVSPSMDIKHDLRFHGDGGYIHRLTEGTIENTHLNQQMGGYIHRLTDSTMENMHLNQEIVNLKAKEDACLNRVRLSTPARVENFIFPTPYSPDFLSFFTDF